MDEQPRQAEAGNGPAEAWVYRHEEELGIGKRWEQDRSVRAHKSVEDVRVDEYVPRTIEYAEVERVAPGEEDSGQIETLDDGSVSIPVIEEQLVVTRRKVVRERIIIRKRTEVEHQRVQADLRREHVEISADDEVELTGSVPRRPFPGTERWVRVSSGRQNGQAGHSGSSRRGSGSNDRPEDADRRFLERELPRGGAPDGVDEERPMGRPGGEEQAGD